MSHAGVRSCGGRHFHTACIPEDLFTAVLGWECRGTRGSCAQTLHGSSKKQTLADRYEYVMHGKIFKFRNTNAGGQLRAEVGSSIQ